MDDENDVSPDDILEAERSGRLTTRIGDDPLAEDDGRPAAPATGVGTSSLPPDHPATDSDVDPHEAYDEGLAGVLPD